MDPGDELLDQLAARYGADRGFRHAYPRRSYFLFVYSLRAGDSSGGPSSSLPVPEALRTASPS